MNPLEERLNQLETRVTRYRNFNILLCLLLVTIVTVAATDGISPLQAGSAPDPIPMPEGNVGIPDLPDERIMMYPEAHRAGKVAAQTYDVIRTKRLEIVNDAGQAVVELWGPGGGRIFVKSSEGTRDVILADGLISIDGVIFVNSYEGDKNLVYIGSNYETGDGLISIRNRNEERLIGLSATESSGWIRIDKTGNENLAYLGASTLGNGLLSLSNKSGKDMVSMYANETSGNLRLSNNNDKTIASLGTFWDGDGILEINSKTGRSLITAGSQASDSGRIQVSNSYGFPSVWIFGGDEQGSIATLSFGIQHGPRILTELTTTTEGNGLVRTRSLEGITTWSSNSVQVNTGSSLKGDMDNDGDIDGDDFLLFSENFGKKW